MDFSCALQELKSGSHVARQGWNGKGLWIVLVQGSNQISRYEVDSSIWPGPLLPWIGMKTADNQFVPWLASQSDLLSDDWEVVS